MRRALRIGTLCLAGSLLLVLLCIGAVIVAGNTRGGRRLLERETAHLTGGRVRIAGLGGRFPSRIDIGKLSLSDASGQWMSAEHISLHWSPLALLAWHVHVERFEVGRIDIVRRPVGTRTGGRGGKAHLPAIDIDRLSIHTLELEPAAAGTLARLTVHGSLHYRSMEAARADLTARRTNGPGLYALKLRAAPSTVDANLTLAEPAGGPLEHLLNLPGLGTLALAARLQGPRNAEKIQLTARAGKLHARVLGTVDLTRRAADLTYDIASPAMTLRPGLAWRRIALQGRWHGPLASARANAQLDVAGLQLTDGVRLGALEASLAADGRVLTVRATANPVLLPGSQPRLLRGSPLKLDATLQLHAAHRPLRLLVTNRLFEFKARALTAGTRSATFELRLPDVAPLAKLYHEDIGGAARLSGTIAQAGAKTRLDVDGTGALSGAGLAARLLGSRTRLRLEASITSTTADIEHLSLAGNAVSVSATGTAQRSPPGAATGALRALRARWRISLPDLARISPSTAGSLEIDGTADGPVRALALKVTARSTLSLHGSAPGRLEATVQAHGLPSAPSAVLRATGTLDGAPLNIDAALGQTAANTYHLDIRHASWKSLTANGNLSAGPRLAAARGRLRLRIARLADLRALTGMALAGRIDGSVTLAPAAGHAGARIELTARNVEADGIKGDVSVSATGPIDALRARLSASSPDVHGAPARLTATARLNGARALDLVDFQARYRGQTLRLLSPSRVTFADGVKVRNLRLGAQRAVLALDGQLSPTLNARVSVHHLDAALVDAFVPKLLAQGTLDAEAQLRGNRRTPTGRASLEIAGLKLANASAQGLPAINLRGVARLRDNTADVSARLDAGPRSRLTLSGRAPLTSAGSLSLKLAGKMDAALMNAVLEARGERAAGTLTVDATVSGSVRAPQIQGVVQVAHGDLRDYAQGIHVYDINARLVGEQGVLRIARLTARAGPGHLSATGTIGVLRPRMPIDISLNARGIQPITNDILTANLDADLRVEGTLRHRLDVTGTMRIHRASISIPNAFPPNVATLEVIRPGEARPVRRPRRLVIGLGLTLTAPEAIFVRGRGLNAQLGGRLKITGTSARPQVSGGFSMTRGTFALAGTSLTFTRGRVGFNGEGLRGGIDPTLDFLAETSVVYTSPTTVRLRVTGFADTPKISLSSSPPLPQDDLLALLLFGKPASKLSPYELAETGAALASLGGVGGAGAGSYNPLAWIRRSLGLNTLSVASATTERAGTGARGGGGTSLTAGKYLSNRVYVAATQSTKGASQIRVDVALTRHLKLETRLGNGTATTQGTTPQNDPGSSIGLSYQLRY